MFLFGRQGPSGAHGSAGPAGRDHSEEPERKRSKPLQQQPGEMQDKVAKTQRALRRKYGDAEPKAIMQKLLHDDLPSAADQAGGAPGGGWNLVCYLLSIPDHPRLQNGINAWLESQLPRYSMCAEQLGCLREAVQLLPQIQGALSGAVVLPTGFSAHMTGAFAPRSGDVARSAQSRSEIRQNAMDSMAQTRAYMAQLEVGEELFKQKQPLARGRMLGAAQLKGANELVRAKVQTSKMREELPPDDEEPEGAYDMFGRQPGRKPTKQQQQHPGPSPYQPPPQRGPEPPPPKGFQLEPPDGVAGRHLVGWKIKGTFETGPMGATELRWHDGYVVEWRQLTGPIEYRCFFPVDNDDDWVSGINEGIAYRRPHLEGTRVTTKEIKDALDMLTEEDQRREEEGGCSS